MKVFKVTLMIVDTDEIGAEGIIEELLSTKYANHCIDPEVMEIDQREVEWNDDHPLNKSYLSAQSAFWELFNQPEKYERDLYTTAALAIQRHRKGATLDRTEVEILISRIQELGEALDEEDEGEFPSEGYRIGYFTPGTTDTEARQAVAKLAGACADDHEQTTDAIKTMMAYHIDTQTQLLEVAKKVAVLSVQVKDLQERESEEYKRQKATVTIEELSAELQNIATDPRSK